VSTASSRSPSRPDPPGSAAAPVRSRCLALALALTAGGAALGAMPVSAQPPQDETLSAEPVAGNPWAPPPPPADRWYGWQTLLVDGVTGTAALIGLVNRNEVLPWVALPALALGAPIVHAAHLRLGATIVSLLMHFVTATVLFGFGAATPPPLTSGWVGLGALLCLTAGLDAGLLGWDRAARR